MAEETIDKAKRECLLKWWANFFLCFLIFLAVAFAVKRISEASDLVTLINPEVQATPHAGLVSLESYRFEINRVTRQVQADFTLINKSAVLVRDIVISCDLKDRSGEHWGNGEWIIYDSLAPETSKDFEIKDKRYISHRVTPDSITCRVIDARPSAATVASAEHNSGH